MSIRHASGAIAAAALLCIVVAAQAQDNTIRTTDAEVDTPITLVGCIQREADYRRQNDSGRGGVAGTGLGRGNEYILINASKADAAGAAAPIDCASSTGEAYELTGNRERELESFVGRQVQISGMLKHADLEEKPVGTSGSARPEGGLDPLGQDLKLFEVSVTSFSEVTGQSEALSIEQPAAPTEERAPQPVGTSGAESAAAADESLPSTASPLAMTGFIGLLSLGGAYGLRRLRRR